MGHYLYLILIDCIVFAGPPLLVATIAAFIISLFQAVTQIQDQTLPQTVKIVVIVGFLLVFGRALSEPLYRRTIELFDNFGTLIY